MRRWTLGCISVGLVASACGHSRPPPCEKPESVQVILKSGGALNPGDDGHPLPTLVRVYLLRGNQGLSTASADDLQKGDRELLGPELAESRELTLKANSYEKVRFERPSGVSHVAVMALYRAPEGTTWRAIRPVPPENPGHCHGGSTGKAAKPGETGPRFDFFLDGSRVEGKP